MEAAQLKLDQPVDVREEGGRIVIEAIKPVSYDIANLIAAITDDNMHTPIDMGPAAGHEIW
jgi:antitoxin MazE